MNDIAMQNDLQSIRQLMYSNERFVIAGHVNPDGDAIGSCLGLGMALKKMGKSVRVLLEDAHEKNSVIPGQYLIWREGQSNAIDADFGDIAANPVDFVFVALDCGSAHRLGSAKKMCELATTTICIDHHVSHEHFTTFTLLDPDASSTCSMIYKLIRPMGVVDKDIASALYCGILTDTGGFRHPNVNSVTHEIVADLLTFDIPFTELYNEMFRRHSLEETLVLRGALNNLRLLANGKVALGTINSDEMSAVGGRIRDTDGIAEYLLNIRGVEASIFIYEKNKGQCKISMRSLNIDISKVASKFGGGGHVHAAGASIDGEFAKVVASVTSEVVSTVRNRLEVLEI
ncbi:MAG: DHH family phosphoesterase [Clostridiales bacterium]|jgi:phosphoesterase RecJ-like protein|nr:DHH family phosphoesterase [Clostridiales bacterium]